MSRFGVFTISGTPYDLDDMTLDEVEAIEDLAGGQAFSELNFGSAKVMKAIAYTLMRRDRPDLEYDAVGKVRMLDFLPADEGMPDLPPAPGDAEESPNGSPPVAAGAPASAVSTGG